MGETKHKAFLAGLQALFATLVEIEYLESEDISYPPHENLCVEQLREAGFERDAIDLISRMPTINKDIYEGETGFGYGIELSPSSSEISFASGPGIDRAREGHWAGDEKLPPWIVTIARSNGDSGNNITYDLRREHITESGYDGIWRIKRQMPVDEYFENWISKLRSHEWLPWRDGFGYAILPRPTGYEAHLATPSRTREDTRLRHLSLIATGISQPSIDQMFNDHVEILKAEHNIFWSKRLLFEEAGWGQNFDRKQFRQSREEYEEQFREATSLARVGPKGQTIYDARYGGQLREWYRSKAGVYGA